MAASLETFLSNPSSHGILKAASSQKPSPSLCFGNAVPYCRLTFKARPRTFLVKDLTHGGSLSPELVNSLKWGRSSPVGKNGRICAAAAGASPPMDQGKGTGGAWLKRLTGATSPPASDIVWAALGAFAGMAALSYLDKHLVQRGLTPLTIGPTAAIAVILTASPNAPVAARWNIFVAHMGAALVSIAALALLGPGWLARAVGVAASVAFMQFTGSIHPPAAGLALLFVDSAKHQALGWRYILFPGLAAALVLVVVTEAVSLIRRSFS